MDTIRLFDENFRRVFGPWLVVRETRDYELGVLSSITLVCGLPSGSDTIEIVLHRSWFESEFRSTSGLKSPADRKEAYLNFIVHASVDADEEWELGRPFSFPI